MLACLALAATVLASPPPLETASQLPKGAVCRVLGRVDQAANPTLPRHPPVAEPGPQPFLWGWVDQLAVVKPHRGGPTTPRTLQMFLLVAPMKGQVGVHALGTF